MFGKFNIADALRQYGINPCTIVEGRNADAQFPFSDWNKEQLKQVNHLVDHIYSGFVQKVSPVTSTYTSLRQADCTLTGLDQ